MSYCGHLLIRIRSGGAQPAEKPLESDSTAGLIAEHNSELFTDEITVPPGMTIIRWHIDTAYSPLLVGGRPPLHLPGQGYTG
jgi:hypothetical protein